MTQEEREIIRRTHQQWVDEMRHQRQMTKDLRVVATTILTIVTNIEQRQDAHDQMLQAIEDLLELQHD